MTYQTQQAYGPFTADFGRWTVTPTSRSHAYVDANSGSASHVDDADGLRITIRGIPYGVSAHLYPDGDGGWIERAGADGRGDLYASRLDRYTGPRDLYPSRSALDAIRSKLYPAVAEWLNGPEGKAALELAERVDATNRLIGIDEEIVKAKARVAELRAERKAELKRWDATVPPVTCRHCHRIIVEVDGAWIDPEATGDDAIWRETCDAHDTFTAEHEPADARGVTGEAGPIDLDTYPSA